VSRWRRKSSWSAARATSSWRACHVELTLEFFVAESRRYGERLGVQFRGALKLPVGVLQVSGPLVTQAAYVVQFRQRRLGLLDPLDLAPGRVELAGAKQCPGEVQTELIVAWFQFGRPLEFNDSLHRPVHFE